MTNFLRDLRLADILDRATSDRVNAIRVVANNPALDVYRSNNVDGVLLNLIDELGYDTFDDLMEDITDVETYSDSVEFTIAGAVNVVLYLAEEYDDTEDAYLERIGDCIDDMLETLYGKEW